jgi:hypothetical protein
LNASAEATRTEQLTQQKSAIDAFAEDPANPYFYDVADEIALLIRSSGGAMTLKEAYDKAVHLNPVTRARETERITAAAVEKAQKEATERAAAAKRASNRVRTSGHQGGDTAASGSMEDTMQATLDSIRSRTK